MLLTTGIWPVSLQNLYDRSGYRMCDYFKVKKVILDFKETYKFMCPTCKVWGYLDDDQYNGRVSIQCECGYHETLNLAFILRKKNGD